MPIQEPMDVEYQIAELGRQLQLVQQAQGLANMRFLRIAECLLELAIQNRALKKCVGTTSVYQSELNQAREDFKDLNRKIKALVTDLATLPEVVDELTKRCLT
jgi:hypothetical protein